MNRDLYGLVLVFLGMIVVHRLMALPQIRRLNRQLAELKKSGPVSSVGLSKSWLGNRAYVLITTKEGRILSGYQTSGNTVFASFRPDTALTETHYSQILESLGKKKKLSRLERAKQMAAQYLSAGLQEQGLVPSQESETSSQL